MSQNITVCLKVMSIYFLLLQQTICFAAYTNIPNIVNNRIASAMAGQIASQNLKVVTIQSSVVASMKTGAIVGVVDAVARRITSNFLDCPTQGYLDVILISGSTLSRAVISGLLFSYLDRYGFGMSPIMYSGIYAVADTLITGGINIQMYGTKYQIENFRQTLLGQSLWQGIYAIAFSAVGNTMAYLCPSHKYTANFITQIAFMYGAAVAYITYIEFWLAFHELKNLG